jgi:cyanoexosortase B
MQLQQKLPPIIQQNVVNLALGFLLAVLYVPLLLHWVHGWLFKSISIEHEYFSHGLIGLPFAAYLAWENRKKWKRLPDRAHPFGAFCLVLGAIFYLTGVTEWVNLSFPLILAGLCLWFKGIKGLKLQGLPLLFVFLATPNAIPYLLTPYTLPLQTFIATAAGFILLQFRIPVEVQEIYLTVNGKFVEVAPYCAGLKMLFTSLYVALMVLVWTEGIRSRITTILLLIGAATLSVAGNVIRNTLLTYFHGAGMDGAFAWLHEGWGGDVYSACLLGLIVLLFFLIERFDPAHETPLLEDAIASTPQDATVKSNTDNSKEGNL